MKRRNRKNTFIKRTTKEKAKLKTKIFSRKMPDAAVYDRIEATIFVGKTVAKTGSFLYLRQLFPLESR